MTGIVAAAYELGAQAVELDAWCRQQGVTAATAQALHANGARRFHDAGAASLVDLGRAAIGQALAGAALAPQDVDLLVVYQTSPCNTLPMPYTLAGALRQAAGLRRSHALAINLQMCVSPVHALRVIGALFARHPHYRHAVLAGVDKILMPRLRTLEDVGVHSDGAGALVLARDGGAGVHAIETYNDAGGMLRTVADPDHAGAPFDRYGASENYLWTLISVARRILRSAGIEAAQLVSVLPHNVNLTAWRQALAALRIAPERLYDANIGRTGHLFGSDIAVNLHDAGALRTPGHHLVVSSGVGGCFGGFILTTSQA